MARKAVHSEGKKTALSLIEEFFVGHPDLVAIQPDFQKAFDLLLEGFEEDRTLFLCGNGGSYADCLHIGGELVKTFERQRPLLPEHIEGLLQDDVGMELVGDLQSGFRAVTLGLSGSLTSAIWNDSRRANIHYAQELYVMGNVGDVLLAISTSGMAQNVIYAMAVARLLKMKTIALTGEEGGTIAHQADVALRLPGQSAWKVQESHLPVYHLLCRAVEAAFYPEMRK